MAAETASAGRVAYEDFSLKRKFGYWTKVYKELSKFRLSALVVSTASAGYVVGSGETIEWAGLVWTSVGTMMCSACANTCNQLMEIRNDRMMKRTMMRPLPSGRVGPRHAAAFAALMGVGGVSLLAWKTNSLTAALGAGNIGLYAGIYTPLKQISAANTWVGAVVGAIPPLMGWAAARGELDVGAGALAAVLYFWQLPHFLALAWMCKEDYAAGGYRMLSLTDQTGKRVAAAALRNCFYLAPIGVLAFAAGVTTLPFAFECSAVTAYMGYYAAKFYADPTVPRARLMFRSSLMHLPLLMAAMIAHRIPQGGEAAQPDERTYSVVAFELAPSEVRRQVCGAMERVGQLPSRAYAALFPWHGRNAAEHPRAPLYADREAADTGAGARTSVVVTIPHDSVPFPFLALPQFPTMSCPSRIICEEGATKDGEPTAEKR